MKHLIIQTSHYHTGSTFLINALYGLVPELANCPIIGEWTPNFMQQFDDIIIVKAHEVNIDLLIRKYNNSSQYKLYFICSERSEKNLIIPEKYKLYNNVVVFDFTELNETKENTIAKIIDHIYSKIHDILNIELNVESGINRIVLMNQRYEEIKTLPFDFIDPFFEIHGSHRNRPT